ncbi:MAG: LSU ribosomal protein L35p, partial [uncultured Thermoleophilia bacterium]
AEDQDELVRQEADQAHGDGQAEAPPGQREPPAGQDVAEAASQALAGPAARHQRPAGGPAPPRPPV